MFPCQEAEFQKWIRQSIRSNWSPSPRLRRYAKPLGLCPEGWDETRVKGEGVWQREGSGYISQESVRMQLKRIRLHKERSHDNDTAHDILRLGDTQPIFPFGKLVG